MSRPTDELPVRADVQSPWPIGDPGELTQEAPGRDARPVNGWLWKAYLAAGALAVALYSLTGSGVGHDVAYVSVGLSSVIAIVLGSRLNEPARPLPWLLMAAGQLAWVVGDAIDSWQVDVQHISRFPSLADAFYLGAYPILGWALVQLIRLRQSGRDVAGLLDSAIVTAGLGVLSWVVLAHPTFLESQQSVAASSVGLAYPVADIILVGLLARLVTTPGGRTPAFRLLLSAVALLILGDSASDLVNLVSSGSSSFDFLWLSSYILWGAAALHPSMRTISSPSPDAAQPFTGRRLIVLALATLTAPATLAAQLIFARRVDGWAIVAGSVVLFLLVVGRMNLAIDQIVASNRQRERLQADLAYQASHDSLTRLPNRAHVLSLIEGAMHRGQRSGALVAVLFVDLDRFKAVNDAFGHGAGDDVLRAVAARMQAEVRGGDVVARLGGDEFVVLLEPVESQEAVIDVAQRLIAAVSAPIDTAHAGTPVAVGASIGVGFSLDGDTDPERLLGEADAAAYRAKALGRGRVEVFDESLRRHLHDRADLEAAISHGLTHGEFEMVYQPVVDVKTQRLQGFEALIRWNRPGSGQVMPDDFIPVAESSRLICDVDRWALDTALAQLAQWSARVPDLWVAVNISGRHISDPRVVADVREALAASGVEGAQLVLELTETIRIDDFRAVDHLQQLRELGVSVSIDDFGTGYNSIIQMQNLPVDSIKIDRSFIASTHTASEQLVLLIVQAAHAFGFTVIAEGVELAEQLSTLDEVGCDSAQGYLIARPLPAAAAERFLLFAGAVTL